MEVIHQILLGLWAIVPHDPVVLISLAGTGTFVAIVLQLVKHFGKLQEAKKTVTALLGLLSFLGDQAANILNILPPNAAGQLGWVITFAVFMHRFAVSPAYYRLVKVLENFQRVFTDAKAYRAEITGQEKTAVTAADIPTPESRTFSLGL